MTSPVVPPTMTAPPPAPDRADRATFSARATALAEFNKTTGVPEMQTAINSAYTNAVSAHEAADEAAANQNSAELARDVAIINAQAAAASSGATEWTSGTYSTGVRKWSPSNQRLYSRRAPGGASPTDPASDKTNWAPVPIDLPNEVISGTSGTLRPNVRHVATNAATCAFALDPMTDGDVIEIDFQNGRMTNTFDIGSMTIKGINGTTATGVITNDVEGLVRLYHDGTYLRSAA